MLFLKQIILVRRNPTGVKKISGVEGQRAFLKINIQTFQKITGKLQIFLAAMKIASDHLENNFNYFSNITKDPGVIHPEYILSFKYINYFKFILVIIYHDL